MTNPEIPSNEPLLPPSQRVFQAAEEAHRSDIINYGIFDSEEENLEDFKVTSYGSSGAVRLRSFRNREYLKLSLMTSLRLTNENLGSDDYMFIEAAFSSDNGRQQSYFVSSTGDTIFRVPSTETERIGFENLESRFSELAHFATVPDENECLDLIEAINQRGEPTL